MNKQFLIEHKWSALLAAVLLVASIALAYRYARPAVPSEVVMATGTAGGAYEAYAKRYAAVLAEEGITLKLRPTKGATENLSLLLDEHSGVDLAFVQNGLIEREQAEEKPLESLGSFFYEPVLVFYRPQAFAKPVVSLDDVRGKKVAVGAEGSGTRVLALSLFALHDIKPNGDATSLVEVGGEAAASALRSGAVDAAVFVGSVASPMIQSLFRDTSLRVADLEYAETYMRRLSQVSAVTLPKGVIDVAKGLPAQTIRTVATTSSLVARDDLHPAVTFLLMKTAKRLHGGAGPVSRVNEFPTFAYAQDFLPSADAERLMKEGTPFLYRYLPFKVANLVTRAMVFLIPLLAVFVSLSDWIPKLIAMRVKSKVFRHYKEMKAIDESVRSAKNMDELNVATAQLEALDAAVGRLKVPTSYSSDQFGIRDHMDLVRVRIERKREALRSSVAT